MKLIFIYNANSGKLNAYIDSLHKIFSPKTYPCSLCDITYGIFREKEIWKRFRAVPSGRQESKNIDMEFLHIDEFEKAYKSKWLQKFDYPVVLTTENQNLEIFISKEELNGMQSPEELIGLIEQRL